jgi:hypothetical protein
LANARDHHSKLALQRLLPLGAGPHLGAFAEEAASDDFRTAEARLVAPEEPFDLAGIADDKHAFRRDEPRDG